MLTWEEKEVCIMKQTEEQRKEQMLNAIAEIARILPMRLLKKLYYLALELGAEL